MSGEWAKEGLHCVKEPGEHLATRECGEEVGFVAFYDSSAFVPVMVAVEEDMVDGMSIAAVRTCRVVPGVLPEAGRVGGIEGMTGNDLEGC